MNKQFKDITKWQRKVFPHATVESIAAHLKDEIDEIIEAHQNKHEVASLAAELADAYILLIGMVDRAGLDLRDLYTAVEAKMQINKLRVWGQPDERGVIKHIEQAEQPKQVSQHTSNKMLGDVCEKCKEKDDLIKHLNRCIKQQKDSIEMLHKMLGKGVG